MSLASRVAKSLIGAPLHSRRQPPLCSRADGGQVGSIAHKSGGRVDPYQGGFAERSDAWYRPVPERIETNRYKRGQGPRRSAYHDETIVIAVRAGFGRCGIRVPSISAGHRHGSQGGQATGSRRRRGRSGVGEGRSAERSALRRCELQGRNDHRKHQSDYSTDTLYMLVQYEDPTESVRRSPYQKQADGSWKKITDPDDKGGDNNKFYEDKLALIWNISGSIKGFDRAGCMATCHAGEPGKAFGNKYTQTEGELGDIWHLKSIRTGYIGQADDQYVDHTRYDKDKAPEAGRKSDPKTGGGYDDIKLVNGKPEFMHKSGTPANQPGGTYYLRQEEKVPFDDAKFKPGDEVASILVAPFTGDRGDIAAAIKWQDGKWTAVMARKLVTGSKTDVQFDKLDSSYEFGIAAFDNAQVRHAYQVGALKLKFAE